MIKSILRTICLDWLVNQQEAYLGLWRHAQDAIKDAILKRDIKTTRKLQTMALKYLTMAEAIYFIHQDVSGVENEATI